jgi:hypothetical protein
VRDEATHVVAEIIVLTCDPGGGKTDRIGKMTAMIANPSANQSEVSRRA